MMNACLAMIAPFSQLGEVGLELALRAGVFGALLAILVLGVCRVLGRKLTAGEKNVLWGLVLIRLVLLWGPASAWSLQGWLFPTSSTPAIAQDLGVPVSVDWAVPLAAAPLASSGSPAVTTAPSFARTSAPEFVAVPTLGAAVAVAWLAGGLLVVGRASWLQWRFSRRVKSAPECLDERLVQLWKSCCTQVGLRRTVPIILCDVAGQPAVTGCLRPKLLLPGDVVMLDDEQLQMIMVHELAHIRRWDIAGNWLLVLVQAVQWWNPVYWFAANRYRSYREQACDAFVLRRLSGFSRRGYSELILTLAGRPAASEWQVALPVSMLGFLPAYLRKRAVGERLRALQRLATTRPRLAQACAAAVTLVAAAFCGLSSATPPAGDHEEQTPLPITVVGDSSEVPAEQQTGPAETQTYDLTAVVARLQADDPLERNLPAMIEHLVANLVPTRRGVSTSAPTPEAISGETAPTGWSYQLNENQLTVHAPKAVQAEVAAYLNAWEASGLGQIMVECRFITTGSDLGAAAGLVWQFREADVATLEEGAPLPAGNGAPRVRAQVSVHEFPLVSIAQLSAMDVEKLLERAQADRRTNTLQAPRLTLFNGQFATIHDVTQRPFVLGTKTDSSGAQRPNQYVLEEGIKVALRPIHSADRSRIRLSGRVELHGIDQSRESQVMLQGKPTRVTIPSSKQCRIDVACEVPDGDSVLIGCTANHLDGRILYTLVTARTLATVSPEVTHQ